MKGVKELIKEQNRFTNIELEKYFDEELKDDTFKKVVSKCKLPKEELIKYTSLFKDSACELKNCSTCKNILECKNSVTGHVYYPSVENDNIVFSYVPCKYKKKLDKDNKYKENIISFDMPREIMDAYNQGLVTEEEIRTAAVNAYTIRAALGMFSDDCEYDKISIKDLDTDESAELSYKASVNSTVLLKNDGILPLNKDEINTIAVIGPTATSIAVLEGNYNGTSSRYVNNLQGIRNAVNPGTRVLYSEGAHLFNDRVQNLALEDDRLSEAETVARASDVVVLYVGLDSTIEGEEGDTGNAFAAGDKTSLFLPESQRKMIERVVSTGKPVIVVCNTGSAIDFSFEEEHANAIIQSWYSGQAGGQAVADILFGEAVPGGKLPVTFYKDGTQPPIEDYSMKNRTYRYFEGEPLYPFGYGLSYSSFEYSDVQINENDTEAASGVSVSVTIKNVGNVKADEVAELYIDNMPAEKLSNNLNTEVDGLSEALDPANQPKYSLEGFERITLAPGESGTVTFKLGERAFDTVLEDGRRVKLRGSYHLYVGGQQPDTRSTDLTGKKCLEGEMTI